MCVCFLRKREINPPIHIKCYQCGYFGDNNSDEHNNDNNSNNNNNVHNSPSITFQNSNEENQEDVKVITI